MVIKDAPAVGQGVAMAVQFVKGVGPRRAEILAKLGITTVEDLFYYLPRKYQEPHKLQPIASLKLGESVAISGELIDLACNRRYRGKSIIRAMVEDETGSVEVVWFGQSYLKDRLAIGAKLMLAGKVRLYKGLQLTSPKILSIGNGYTSEELDSILPHYGLTRGINQPMMRKIVRNALAKYLPAVGELLPAEILKKRRLPKLPTAIKGVHFPEMDEAKKALERLKYDELFLFELGMALRRQQVCSGAGIVFKAGEKLHRRIQQRFPFKLTAAQRRVVEEICKDLTSGEPMNRLLQGDVGSGKTVVALYAMLIAVTNHYQSALMAPTEILAQQHYNTVRNYLADSRVRICCLTGGDGKERRRKLLAIARGEFDIVVGTHALIQDAVEFSRLGLIVVDEQHKFGVRQRAELKGKATQPMHTLVMTATPIPRTLSLTVFGDLDISVIDALPPGRGTVKTAYLPPAEVGKTWNFIHRQVRDGRQAYIIYPLVEESENLNVKGARERQRYLAQEVFPEFDVRLIHGRMDSQRKNAIMSDFRSGRFPILVSTVLVEVGIDVPNATVMLIEHFERFGLAQLHQLRGRIRRSRRTSYCILTGEAQTDAARARLKVMLSTTDGFKIAEEDLRIRGPGEFFGTRQSGMPELKIANIVEDYPLLQAAREDAFALVAEDPKLASPQLSVLREKIIREYGDRFGLISTG